MPEFVIVNTHNKYYKDFVYRSYSFACTLSRLNSIYGGGAAKLCNTYVLCQQFYVFRSDHNSFPKIIGICRYLKDKS
jgi:hypothetical protein